MRFRRLSQNFENNELDITPIMNLLVILIPFLISTAVFTQYSLVKMNLKNSDDQVQETSSSPVEVHLNYNKKHQVAFKNKILYNFNSQTILSSLIDWLKTNSSIFQNTQDGTIFVSDSVVLNDIIQTVTGLKTIGIKNISFTESDS